MKTVLVTGAMVLSLAGCIEETSSDEFIKDVYTMDPNGPQTEVILKRYPKVDPEDVQIHFSYSTVCENPQDVGLMIGWGDKGQARGEIIHDFQTRAAKYGADMVVYVGSVSSVAQLDEVLHQRSEYSLMRCP